MYEKFEDFRSFVDMCFVGPFGGFDGQGCYEWQPSTQEAVAKLGMPFHVALTNYRWHNNRPSNGMQPAVEVFVKNPCEDGPRYYLAHRQIVHKEYEGENLLRELQAVHGYAPIPPFVEGQQEGSEYLLLAAQSDCGLIRVGFLADNGCSIYLWVHAPGSDVFYQEYFHFFRMDSDWSVCRQVYEALKALPSNAPGPDAP